MISLVAKTGKKIWVSESVRSLLADSDIHDPVEAMRAKAAALIEQCEFDGPPIDHEMAASFRGIEDVQAIEMNEAGMLVPIGPKRFRVYINERDAKPRQRFSCGHEVSHTLFPNYFNNPIKKTDMVTGEYEVDAEEEYLCDVGAAELLMPRKFFHPALREMGCSIEALVALARMYEVSFEAAAVQLVKAAIHECAIIVWQPGHKPSQKDALNPAQGSFEGMEELAAVPKQLRTKYALTTPGIPHFFPKDKSVEKDSPIHHCYLNGEICKGESSLGVGNSLNRFYTESLFVPIETSDGFSDGKVITIVLPSQSAAALGG